MTKARFQRETLTTHVPIFPPPPRSHTYVSFELLVGIGSCARFSRLWTIGCVRLYFESITSLTNELDIVDYTRLSVSLPNTVQGRRIIVIKFKKIF